MDDLMTHDGIEEKYTATGRFCGYEVTLYHEGLDEYKYLSAAEEDILLSKIRNQVILWVAKWKKILDKEKMQTAEKIAEDLTAKARAKNQEMETILEHTLNIDDSIDWDTLKYNDDFCWNPEERDTAKYITFNKQDGYPKTVHLDQQEETPEEQNFLTKIGFFHKLIGATNRIRAEQRQKFRQAVEDAKAKNTALNQEQARRKEKLAQEQKQWEEDKIEFEEKQDKHNEKIDELKRKHKDKDAAAVVEYCEMVLNNSEYPNNFPKKFDIQYIEANRLLIVDCQLPSMEHIPSIDSVRYIKSRDVTEEKKLSQSSIAGTYDSVIYQIALRTFHELFEADIVNALEVVILNGFVTAVSPATGHEVTSCIISVQTTKEIFEAINLKGIVNSRSYKECFKSLKGIGSSKLSTMTAVKPLVNIDKSDRRFTDHYEVAGGLSDEKNIAAIHWEEFEHLVREIFQKEFADNGGEVKVTQASSDGGVDAIAFDPDPIRGGKIVIQAKRYTNVVGVAAVRDLYGTVMNEGATKGILVTTSDYGADSYEFAKDKPITLMNGSNLLYLLEKHGHKAKIDLREAKQILKKE